jgi:hypothetical protein
MPDGAGLALNGMEFDIVSAIRHARHNIGGEAASSPVKSRF